jgi:hypothetical protein
MAFHAMCRVRLPLTYPQLTARAQHPPPSEFAYDCQLSDDQSLLPVAVAAAGTDSAERSGSCTARASTAWENASLFEFPLCLSRACLDQMIICSLKWRKKTRFLTWKNALL